MRILCYAVFTCVFICYLERLRQNMILKPNFEVVDIADEYVIVPVGDEAVAFSGVVALSDAAAFLLKNMKEQRTEEDLVSLLVSEYDVDEETARNDVKKLVQNLSDMGVITE